jgi:hypothetical protein
MAQIPFGNAHISTTPLSFANVPLVDYTPEFDEVTKSRILHCFPDTVLPDQDICPRSPTSPAVIQDLLEKFQYAEEILIEIEYPITQAFPIKPVMEVESEIKRCLNSKFLPFFLSNIF